MPLESQSEGSVISRTLFARIQSLVAECMYAVFDVEYPRCRGSKATMMHTDFTQVAIDGY